MPYKANNEKAAFTSIVFSGRLSSQEDCLLRKKEARELLGSYSDLTKSVCFSRFLTTQAYQEHEQSDDQKTDQHTNDKPDHIEKTRFGEFPF